MDPGEFFRNSPIRSMVMTLRLRFILLWQVAVPLRGEGKKAYLYPLVSLTSPLLWKCFLVIIAEEGLDLLRIKGI